MNDKLREFWLKVRLFWSKARYAIIPLVTLMCLYQAGVALTLLPQFSSVQYTLSKTLNREIDALSISIDGNYYGTVESQKAVQTAWGDAIERIIDETGVNYKIDAVYHLTETEARTSEMTQSASLTEAFYQYIRTQLQYYSFVGYAVHVDDAVFVLRSEREVLNFFTLLAEDALDDKVLSAVCTSFTNGEPNFDITYVCDDETETISFVGSSLEAVLAVGSTPSNSNQYNLFEGIYISGEKGYQTVYVREEDVLTSAEAYRMCVSPTVYETDYEIAKGDTIKSVLKTFNMTMEQFLELNSSYNAKSSLSAGRILRVLSSEKRVEAYQVYRRVTNKNITASVVYSYDETKEASYSKVISPGSDGMALVDEFVYVSGATEEQTRQIGEVLIKAAVAQEVLVGSKAAPTFIWPTEGRLGSRFGRKGAGYTTSIGHTGIDIQNKLGTYVYAAQSGIVMSAAWSDRTGYGIVIDHGNDYATEYLHLSRMLVSEGDYVEQGQVIALMGSTGYVSTGVHLHFAVISLENNSWKYLDPERFLSGR